MHFAGQLPILGICMGLQCIYTAFGGVVDSVGTIVHGKTSKVFHDRKGLFKGLSQGIQSTRYHSLAGRLGTLPQDLQVSAWFNPDEPDEPKLDHTTSIVMGVRHKTFAIEAVQYHPESILSEQGKLLLSNFLALKSGSWSENPQAGVFQTPSSIPERVTEAESLPTILQSICQQRLLDIVEAKRTPGSGPRDLQSKIKLSLAPAQLDFYRRLQPPQSGPSSSTPRQVALMAEIKRASPSKGSFVTASSPTPPEIALSYALAGASTISVLTEPTWFKGTLMDMLSVRLALEHITHRPAILRKDFILDTYQIDEARCYGADTVLLIVACLTDEKLSELFHHSMGLGMEPLVEVNNEEELERALKIGARVIGVNNRNLHDFNVDMSTTSRMVDLIRSKDSNFPNSADGVIICALSGISSRADVMRYSQEGVGAVLVGESLMKAVDKRTFIQELLGTSPSPPSTTRSTPLPRPLVKICGVKTPEIGLFTARAGADFIGLIFVPKSRRYVTPSQANEIIRLVRPMPGVTQSPTPNPTLDSTTTPLDWFRLQATRLQAMTSHRKPLFVGVFQDACLDEIMNVVAQVPIDLIQLHGHEPIQLSHFLELPVIRTFHVRLGATFEPRSFSDAFRPGYHSLPLLDSQTSEQTGGTGKSFDWSVIESIRPQESGPDGLWPMILAGGLDVENVTEAVRQVKPLVVDVSGGVEDLETGEKDPMKIMAFIKAVQNAIH